MKEEQIKLVKDGMAVKGFTTPKLAEVSGVSLPTLRRMLNARHDYNTTVTTITKVATALGIEPEDIIKSEGFSSKEFKGVKGYIDYRGEIKRIESIKDLEKITDKIRKELQAPKEVQKLKRLDKDNQKTQSKVPIDISSIDLHRKEAYDTSKVYTWSFRKSDDEKEEIVNDLGNMCKGYPFKVCGVDFLNSECAYISGLFSQPDPKSISIQKELQESDNGYEAKKAIRRKYEQVGLSRADWQTFNVQWMLYVVWQKVSQNKAFADKLKKIPKYAMIVENSTYQKGETAMFWGMKNLVLKEALETVEVAAELENYQSKRKIAESKKKEKDSLNHIGIWEGVNCMGKILTICKHCLEGGTEPPIDYELLRKSQINLLGKLLTFEEVAKNVQLPT